MIASIVQSHVVQVHFSAYLDGGHYYRRLNISVPSLFLHLYCLVIKMNTSQFFPNIMSFPSFFYYAFSHWAHICPIIYFNIFLHTRCSHGTHYFVYKFFVGKFSGYLLSFISQICLLYSILYRIYCSVYFPSCQVFHLTSTRFVYLSCVSWYNQFVFLTRAYVNVFDSVCPVRGKLL